MADWGATGARSCEVYVARRRYLHARHSALLDDYETERRARFRMEADRDRFTLAAVLLRAVVGRCTGVDAWSVTVDRTCGRCGRPHGRPRLPCAGLETSVSHSGDVVVVAVTAAGPVGVDVELVARGYAEVLPSVCTKAEQSFVRTPGDFYAYWTRKEAVLKATGEGLEREMTDVVVTPPGSAPSLVSLAGVRTLPCCMADVLADGYAGAVAVLTSDPVEFLVIDAGAVLNEW
jgi:4'-phosphopantetheinyl transferase